MLVGCGGWTGGLVGLDLTWGSHWNGQLQGGTSGTGLGRLGSGLVFTWTGSLSLLACTMEGRGGKDESWWLGTFMGDDGEVDTRVLLWTGFVIRNQKEGGPLFAISCLLILLYYVSISRLRNHVKHASHVM